MQCPNPEIVAGQLISIRNIYLRQEIHTIAYQIQEHYKDRLPALRLVSLAVYEQVFNRQPLSPPEELRREAVKYGRKYYELSLKKLHLADERNNLRRSHNRLRETRPGANQSELSDSRRSTPSGDRTSGNEQSDLSNSSSTGTSDGSRNTSLSARKSSESMRKRPTHNQSPKIIVHRASEKSLVSNKIGKHSIDANSRKRSELRLSPSRKRTSKKSGSRRRR